MQFLVLGYDGKDEGAVERRLAVREAHIANGDKMVAEGTALYGVAILNDEGKMAGSMYVCDFPSRDELDEWLKVEPYVTGKVWEKIEVFPCRVGPSFEKMSLPKD